MKKEAKWCFECTQHALFLFVIVEPEQSGSDYSFGCDCRLHKLKPNWFVLLWTLLKLKRGLSGHEELCLFKKTEKKRSIQTLPISDQYQSDRFFRNKPNIVLSRT